MFDNGWLIQRELLKWALLSIPTDQPIPRCVTTSNFVALCQTVWVYIGIQSNWEVMPMPIPLEWRTAYSTIKTCPTLWVTLPHLAALHQTIERELRGEFLQESKTVHSRGPSAG